MDDFLCVSVSNLNRSGAFADEFMTARRVTRRVVRRYIDVSRISACLNMPERMTEFEPSCVGCTEIQMRFPRIDATTGVCGKYRKQCIIVTLDTISRAPLFSDVVFR
jgi:hypothetical protein